VHVAVTLNGSACILYLNGKVVGTNTEMAFTPSRLGVTTNNWIGRSQFDADPYLKGQMADFRIYRGTQTSAELTSLLATRKSVTPP
jgi:Concanavalin A-like lectin/glucanases superfamily